MITMILMTISAGFFADDKHTSLIHSFIQYDYCLEFLPNLLPMRLSLPTKIKKSETKSI